MRNPSLKIPRATRPALPRRALLLATFLSAAPVAADPPAPWPAPAQGPVAPARADQNATCEGCHLAIAEEWRASMHRHSFDDPPFARALTIEPLPFCRGCHAPEADPARLPPRQAANDGVSCVTCHVPRDEVLAAPRSGTGTSPHALLRDPRFASDAACAPCHEFAFPGARSDSDAESMQRTATEHARSPSSGRACASCHMPATGEGAARHRSHAFAQARSPGALAAALSVSVHRVGPSALFALAPRGVGHALPTGDLFRRIELAVEAVDTAGKVRARNATYLGRQLGPVRRGPGLYVRGIVADTRLTEPTEIAVDLPPAGARSDLRIRWRVTYQRIEHPTGRDPSSAISGEDVVLAGGYFDGPATEGAN